MSNKIIRLPEVKLKTGLSRSTIYLRMSNGEFPQSVSLGRSSRSRAIGWLESDIDEWLEDCIAASKAASHES
ncbi:helix-turn-helix transcriptional regulator [Aliivibrio kagoshimensis]|uniref:helix-turn-helix transcriptional regulator n=1 Tax=Aliivibrio kagoshimensis TaxID=2910230 RepID=UPI003D0BD373